MKLRLRWKEGTSPIEVPDNATLGTLCAEVVKITQIARESFSLKSGFPPQEILAGDADVVCGQHVREGELLTLSMLEAKQAMSTKPPPKSLRQKLAPSSSTTTSDGSPQFRSLHDPPLKRRRVKPLFKGGNKEEWSVELVEAFSSKCGKNATSAQRMLRGVFRKAVELRELSTLAEQRWAAVEAKTYDLQELSAGARPSFRVSFSVGRRKPRSEEYLSLPSVLISAVVRQVHDSDGQARLNLRPVYMAEGQPMIFWNIVRLFKGDFFQGLKELAPDIDWAFVHERHRTLTAKGEALQQNLKEAAERRERLRKRRLERQAKAAEANGKDEAQEGAKDQENKDASPTKKPRRDDEQEGEGTEASDAGMPDERGAAISGTAGHSEANSSDEEHDEDGHDEDGHDEDGHDDLRDEESGLEVDDSQVNETNGEGVDTEGKAMTQQTTDSDVPKENSAFADPDANDWETVATQKTEGMLP